MLDTMLELKHSEIREVEEEPHSRVNELRPREDSVY